MSLSWGQKPSADVPESDLTLCILFCNCVRNPGGDDERGAWCTLAGCSVRRVVRCYCRIDMILVGAEGVVENGGVINKLGTYQAALSAHCHNTPFYVAAESYKVGVNLSYTHSVRKHAQPHTAVRCRELAPCIALCCQQV